MAIFGFLVTTVVGFLIIIWSTLMLRTIVLFSGWTNEIWYLAIPYVIGFSLLFDLYIHCPFTLVMI